MGSSVELLDKSRKILKLLHNNSSSKVVFDDICLVLTEIMESNVMVFSRKGKLLGIGQNDKIPMPTTLVTDEVGSFIDKSLNERLLSVLSTKENVRLDTLGFDESYASYHGVITPIYIAGKRLGTLFMFKKNGEYQIDDIILCEYGSTVVGLEMTRSVNEEHDEDSRRHRMAKSAANTLSATELKAVSYVFDELEGGEGILVASKIADKVGITRSVIVNGLRKLESAGIIECRSAGMKGTYIKVLNNVIYKEVEE